MNIENYLAHLGNELKDPVMAKDLIKAGLFKSDKCLRNARNEKKLPFDKLSRIYSYKKEDVLNWVRNCYHEEI